MEALQGQVAWLGGLGSKFVDSVCDPESVSQHFRGELGRFTPCFTDIVILGASWRSTDPCSRPCLGPTLRSCNATSR